MSANQRNELEPQEHEAVEPELMAIHQGLLWLHNREATLLKAAPTKANSINATNFLSTQAVMFADAALVLMGAAQQPLGVPVALLRTCLEAQARSNHIIATKGVAREALADELVQLMDLGHQYYEKKVIALSKDLVDDPTKLMSRDRAYAPSMKFLYDQTDLSNLKVLKKTYDDLSRKWTYGIVVERQKFKDPSVLSRSEAQPLQPALDLTYTQCCAFVHSDPVSIRHQSLLTKVGVAYTLVLSELIAVMCFFTALGKESDPDLITLKKTLKAFDVNEKVLPKAALPSQPLST